jgi:hypothetical protein
MSLKGAKGEVPARSAPVRPMVPPGRRRGEARARSAGVET